MPHDTYQDTPEPMPFPFSRKDHHVAHWVRVPSVRGGELRIALPAVLDGVNSRMVRKLVLTRMHECSAIRFDATGLERIGDVGAATLAQILQLAGETGITVVVANLTSEIRDRLMAIATSEREIFAVNGKALGSLPPLTTSAESTQKRWNLRQEAGKSSRRSRKHKAA
ncbi:MAG: hypothetical protein HUU29_11755 [Planctomycetaceae bacterium]|nr:hypothetical protein [Planctomycetaceae bacterium]